VRRFALSPARPCGTVELPIHREPDVETRTEHGTPSAEAYAAFVSYRHTGPDRRWAKWLHASLETYRVPERLVAAGAPRRLGRVFRDEEELAASYDLSARIDDALRGARNLIVV
jgi:hypothetical protein